MKKEDLKNGMILETKNKYRYFLFEGTLISKNGYMNLNSYDENLMLLKKECRREDENGFDNFDIFKVYKLKNYYCGFRILNTDNEDNNEDNMELLWERNIFEHDKFILKDVYNDCLKIKPNYDNNYKVNELDPIYIEITNENNKEGIGLSVQQAKQMIKYLNKVVDYIENED